MTDRRHESRFAGGAHVIASATMRPGCPVTIVNASAGGALIETDRPLRPGSRVHLRLVTDDETLQVVAHVLRCAVWTLHAGEGITYRGALRFESRCAALVSGGARVLRAPECAPFEVVA